jgi:hypothetical protein
VPPSLAAFAPGNTLRKTPGVGTLERYLKLSAQGFRDVDGRELL